MQANKLYILQMNKTNNSFLLELSSQHWIILRTHKVGKQIRKQKWTKNRGRECELDSSFSSTANSDVKWKYSHWKEIKYKNCFLIWLALPPDPGQINLSFLGCYLILKIRERAKGRGLGNKMNAHF